MQGARVEQDYRGDVESQDRPGAAQSPVSAQVPGFRRRIEIATQATPGGGEARAVLEDDYHHFRLTVRHDGAAVTQAWSTSLRHPYSACPLAGDQLAGMPLTPASGEVHRWTDASQQCTHMLDLAGLAIAAAARKVARRLYLGEVPDRTAAERPHLGKTSPRLYRDGQLVLAWEMEGQTILGPAPFADVSLRKGFARLVQETMAPDEAEAALILRRCVAISPGRGVDLDAIIVHAHPSGRCFSQQPSRAESALRMKNSTLDFADRAEQLCQDDQAWLAFTE